MNRKTFVVDVWPSKSRVTEHELRWELEQILQGGLERRVKVLGDTRVHVRRFGDLEEAALGFALAIKQSGEDAVSERIR